jgi:hypothetical protein
MKLKSIKFVISGLPYKKLGKSKAVPLHAMEALGGEEV